jgi:hypothetical protein
MTKERPSRHPTRKLRSNVPPTLPSAPKVPRATTIALPGADAAPRMLLELTDLGFVAIDEESVAIAHLVDGVRTVRELAAARGISLHEARLRVADLRDRHVVAVD